MVSIRPATREDCPLILGLIQELADYEKLSDACVATVAQLEQTLFADRPAAEVLIGSVDGQAVGFALFFHNYSTFLAKPGIYLEDLYVQPAARGKGLGKALLIALAKLAVQRNCGRLEWSVLDWNTPSIDFYRAMGAVPLDEWTIFRVTGDALTTLSQRG